MAKFHDSLKPGFSEKKDLGITELNYSIKRDFN